MTRRKRVWTFHPWRYPTAEDVEIFRRLRLNGSMILLMYRDSDNRDFNQIRGRCYARKSYEMQQPD